MTCHSYQSNIRGVLVSVSLPTETLASTPTPTPFPRCSALLERRLYPGTFANSLTARHLTCPGWALSAATLAVRRRLHSAALPQGSSQQRGRPKQSAPTFRRAAPLPPLDTNAGAPEDRSHRRTPHQHPSPFHQGVRSGEARLSRRSTASAAKHYSLRARVALLLTHRPTLGIVREAKKLPGSKGKPTGHRPAIASPAV